MISPALPVDPPTLSQQVFWLMSKHYPAWREATQSRMSCRWLRRSLAAAAVVALAAVS
jgi:hypothetical protein